ncbi:MAG: hypothetical protein HC859_02590, partial [Bacteroidia bacterium]|nr:hypothetical protein [Bacteroidia bacterium]
MPAIPISFQDSVRIVLENARGVDAQVVGSGFVAAWGSMSLDQQNLIQSQVRLMRKRKYNMKPQLIHYFGALVNAVNIERADARTLANYLDVAGKVIDAYEPVKAVKFFETARTFFQFHAIHYEKAFRLYASDDNYSFDFVAPATALPTVSWDETEPDTASTEEELVSLDDPPASLDDPIPSLDDPIEDPLDEPVDDTQNIMPSWLTPPPPPYQEGPMLKFDKLSLTFVTSYDSVTLRGSKGTFSFLDNMFVGEQGTFEWTPALLGPDTVSCNMTTYFFDTRKAYLKADLVKLSYTGKTPGYVPGTLEYKSVAHGDSVASSYPRFVSYQNDLVIQGVGNQNVTYRGGFSLTGNKISSACVSGEPSTIEVAVGGTKKFKALSTNFQFLDSAIASPDARVVLYQMNDSIAHPDLQFKFSYPSDSLQELYLRKEAGAMAHTPYTASFFGMDFSADVIKWNITQDSLNIETDGGRSTVEMVLESNNFYDAEDYRLLKGVGFSFHPLALVANYCLKLRVRDFYSGSLAQFANKPPEEIKMAMEFLASKGILDYNRRTDLVKVKPKAIEKFKAYKGDADYDNLKIHSLIDSLPNATVNIPKRYMTVRGVEEFKVSDSLNVRIEPDSSIITLLQNRDIKFDGTINAGNFEISGKGFTLKYDSFYINLNQIDSINFYVTEKNAKGQSIRRKVNNSMVGVDSVAAAEGGLGDTSRKSGTLFISLASNKSGKLKVPNYPRLDASSGGVIYFDRKEVLNAAYDRSVFFVVPPFKLDSLNDADPASINFDGTFVSSGMFPSFKEKLHTMPDKSLGFEHSIPPPGYQLYNGEGKLNGEVRFDNRGIRSSGQIDFLAARVSSPDFVFYPDSVIGRGNRALIREEQHGDTWFPQAS